MDFIPNHSSDQHDWFQRSLQSEDPYTDYYVWRDPEGFDDEGEPIAPNNWVTHSHKHAFCIVHRLKTNSIS